MLPSVRKIIGRRARRHTFHHNCDPKNTTKQVKAFLSQKKVKILEWPTQSNDLNPIKHLWEELERQQQGICTISKPALRKIAEDT